MRLIGAPSISDLDSTMVDCRGLSSHVGMWSPSSILIGEFGLTIGFSSGPGGYAWTVDV